MSKDRVIDPNDPYESEVRCIKCGGRVCICEMQDKWTAHCMDCDQKIGDGNGLDYSCDSPQDAKTYWEFINTPVEQVIPDTGDDEYIEEAMASKDSMRMVGIILVLLAVVLTCILLGNIGVKG
jgi:hypothetical protein